MDFAQEREEELANKILEKEAEIKSLQEQLVRSMSNLKRIR